MNVLIVGFDANNTATTKTKLDSVIKSQAGWAVLNSNAYGVTTPMSAAQFRDHLISGVGKINKLFVYTVNNRFWATNGMPVEINKWLQNNWSIT